MTELKTTWYATTGSRAKDWFHLLHWPYSAWHLAYVLLGASLAPVIYLDRVGWTLVAFFCGMALSAHIYDELHGHPLGTKISDTHLKIVGAISLVIACFIGVMGSILVTPLLLVFVAFGGLAVIGYNLELFGLHRDWFFAVSWASFPVLTSFYINALTITIPVVLLALACYFLARAQRVLSTRVREVRRKVEACVVKIWYTRKTEVRVPKEYLFEPCETALKFLTMTIITLSIAIFIFRMGL